MTGSAPSSTSRTSRRDRHAEAGAGAGAALGVADAGPRPLGAGVISSATSFDEALLAGLVALCDGRPDVLAHAVWARGPGSPLLPLAVLCGAGALERDGAAEGPVASVIAPLGVAAERLRGSAPPTDGTVRQGRTPRSQPGGREP